MSLPVSSQYYHVLIESTRQSKKLAYRLETIHFGRPMSRKKTSCTGMHSSNLKRTAPEYSTDTLWPGAARTLLKESAIFRLASTIVILSSRANRGILFLPHWALPPCRDLSATNLLTLSLYLTLRSRPKPGFGAVRQSPSQFISLILPAHALMSARLERTSRKHVAATPD